MNICRCTTYTNAYGLHIKNLINRFILK